MMDLRVVLLGSFFFSIPLPAMAAEWTRCSGPTGGVVHQVVVRPDEPSTVLAASLEGLLKSSDAGSTWTYLTTNMPDTGQIRFLRLVLDPKEKDHIYAGTLKSGLWESEDDGASWSRCLELSGDGSRIRCLVVDPHRPRCLLVGTSGRGPFQSSDGGRTWRRPGGNWRYEDISALFPLPGPGEPVLVAIWGKGLFRARGEMESWERMAGDLPLDRITVLTPVLAGEGLMMGTHGDGLFQTPAGELSFVPVRGSPTGQAVTDLLMNPWRSQMMYLSTDGAGVFHSTDGGQSWSPFNNGLNHKHVYALAISRDWLYAGTCWGGIYRRHP